MGKVKKPVGKQEESQQKISSFFKTSIEPVGVKPSSLFSSIGEADRNSATNACKSGTDPSKAVKCSGIKQDTVCEIVDLTGDERRIKKNREQPRTKSLPAEPIIIPETQDTTTPKAKDSANILHVSCKDNIHTGKDIMSDDDSVIIPDTPDNTVAKSKRQYGRSFLLGAASIYSNPIQKAKENREAKLKMKKQASLARKSLISVSVNFNPTGPQNPADAIAESKVIGSGEVNMGLQETISGPTEVSCGKTDPLACDSVEENPTPTKVYEESASLKRMAKTGTSPDPKRTLNFATSKQMPDEFDVKMKEDSCFSSDIVSAKTLLETRQTSECCEKKQTPKLHTEAKKSKLRSSLSNDSMLTYQLLGHNKRGRNVTEVGNSGAGLEDDETLGDILQELGTTPKRAANENQGKKCFAKQRNNCTASVKERMALSDVSWTKDDESFFSKLGIESREFTNGSESDNILPKTCDIDRKHNCTKLNEENKATESCTKPELRNLEPEIDMFPTPAFVPSKDRPVTPESSEMDIGEFKSQSDSQELCDEFEHLSPFKYNLLDDGSSDLDIFQREPPCTQFGRHTVTDVQADRQKHELILSLIDENEMTKTCILQGFWSDTHIRKGDVVHVLGQFKDNVCHISDTSGQLVVSPDLLLSGTTIVSSVFCMRRSVLKEKFKGIDTGNIHMLYGSIIHTLFQQVLRKKIHTESEILLEAQDILKQNSNLLEMYGAEVSEERVMEEIRKYLPQLQTWIKQHTNIGQDLIGQQRKTAPDVLVTKVQDIEENIWSPRFGIKGKIDLTVEVKEKGDKKSCILPLELKTGKPTFSIEHKGQVTLYSMMSSDRREDPGKGLLLYLREPSMKTIPADKANQKGLLQLRNEMAYYISRQVEKSEEDGELTFSLGRLPEPISNLRACQKCPQLINCAIYQRDVEKRLVEGDGMTTLVTDTLTHLTADHVTYFMHWCLLLDLEVKTDAIKKTVADIWCKTSQQREQEGQCVSGVVLADNTQNINTNSVILSFIRHPHNPRKSAMTSCGLNKTDSAVISCEKPCWIAVCTGFVQHVTATCIDILVDRDGVERLCSLKGRVLRIDKCNAFSTAGIFYTNVSRLMSDTEHIRRLRRLVVDKEKPQFLNTLSKGSIEKVKKVFKQLNKPQKTAILKVLMCRDYVLIRGFPGTGKTSTIVALIKVFQMLGMSVLLTSYTHSAVDNVLLKLKRDGIKFLRLGRVGKIHPNIQDFCIDRQTRGIKTTADLHSFLHSQTIVATSCLGTNHPIFTRRQFDVCIVDEASQVLQPACLGPIFCARSFVLVGDPKQLPPVVQSKDARELGMDESLFLRLEDCGATFDLNLQYRMNSTIMHLSNSLVYDGRLQCGSEEVANNTLRLTTTAIQMCENVVWLKDVLDCSLEKSVVFLDTHQVSASEGKDRTGGFQNVTEAKIVQHTVKTLIQCGVAMEDIGVIAPYRSQVYLLKTMLEKGQSHVEVNTVDQYQGRDKDVILLSFVRSLSDGKKQEGELLNDMRRLNVAITRAKTKLIMVGNSATLKSYPPLRKIIDIVTAQQQIAVLQDPIFK